jgi:hypothetical protein
MDARQQNGTRKGRKNRVAVAERQRRALEARLAGVTYERIARALGYRNASGAWKAVARGMARSLREPAEAVRLLELERLDRLLAGIWGRATGGPDRPADLAALDRVLKIMERRSRLLGLDAPLHLDLHALVADAQRRHGLTDDEARALFDQMTGYLDEQRAGWR